MRPAKSTDSGHPLSGSITVYLALSFLMISALLLTLVEAARTRAQLLSAQIMLDSAMESLFSQWHRPLWEKYRILGLEYRDSHQLSSELYGFMEPYLTAKTLTPMGITEDSVLLSATIPITEDTSYEEEVLEYMKYGFMEGLVSFQQEKFSPDTLPGALSEAFSSGEQAKELSALEAEYRLDTKDVAAVEAAIEDLDQDSKTVASIHSSAASALSGEDPGGFLSDSQNMREELSTLCRHVTAYGVAADRVNQKVLSLRASFEAKKNDLSAAGQAAVEAQLSEYESYASRDGTIRKEIEAMPEKASALEQGAMEVERSVEEFEEWLSEAMANAEEDEDFDEEIHHFYQNALHTWRGLPLFRYQGDVAHISKKNKRLLEQVGELVNGELLPMVLPEGRSLPSRESILPETPVCSPGSNADPFQLALLNVYSFSFFHHFPAQKEDTEDKRTLPPSGSRAAELEYLLNGSVSDYENLSAIVKRLVLLREGMNLVYLYSDAEKRAEARTFASTVLLVGGVASPVLISVLTFFLLSVWALGQAICDVRTLLSGGRVPLLHTAKTFSMTLPGLLELGQGHVPKSDKENSGLSYTDHLRFFLFGHGMQNQAELNARMLTLIQRNISSVGDDKQEGFQVSRCLYAAEAGLESGARHLLLQTGPVQAMTETALPDHYQLSLTSFYKYRNETQ